MDGWEFLFRLVMLVFGDYLDLIILVLFIGVLFIITLFPILLFCLDLLTQNINRTYRVIFFTSLLVASLLGMYRYYSEMPWSYITQWGWRDQLTAYRGGEYFHQLEPVHYSVKLGVRMDNYLTESVLNPINKFSMEDSTGITLMVIQGILLIIDIPALLIRFLLGLVWSLILVLYFYISPFIVKLIVSFCLLLKASNSSPAWCNGKNVEIPIFSAFPYSRFHLQNIGYGDCIPQSTLIFKKNVDCTCDFRLLS